MEFLEMPEELLWVVLSYLGGEDLKRVRSVCRLLKALVADDCLWQGLIQRALPEVVNESLVFHAKQRQWERVFWRYRRIRQPFVCAKPSSTSKASSRHPYTTISFLLRFLRDSFPQLVATYEEEDYKEGEDYCERSQSLSWMQLLLKNQLPSPKQIEEASFRPGSFSYRFSNRNAVYYEVSAFERDPQPPDQGDNARNLDPAIGIGLMMPAARQTAKGIFPGWRYGTVGYHSDDGLFFYQVLYSSCPSILGHLTL